MATDVAALSYHEPNIVTILILSSFLLLENAINYAFDRLLFCGLIGQIAIGVAWGTPGAGWLSRDVQTAIMQLGYLGLILIVYEGGLSTDWKTLKSNLFLSSLVAVMGISAPIALSFTLQGFMNITPVQAFAAGAALCSTSLGTTFTILSTSGLGQSRLGVVLSSAAMMDDIVGLVMSSIVSNLGKSSAFNAITVVRPVLVSIAFAIVLPLLCVWLVSPVTKLTYQRWFAKESSRVQQLLATNVAALTFHTLILAALVAGASYAGTSNLFAAYLAGAASTWWDGFWKDLCLTDSDPIEGRCTLANASNIVNEKQNRSTDTTSVNQVKSGSNHASPDHGTAKKLTSEPNNSPSTATKVGDTDSKISKKSCHHLEAAKLFERYYQPALTAVLKPFFFASIGFSIPISQMFSGAVVWRGIVYSILMVLGKLLCGLCLIRLGSPTTSLHAIFKALPLGTSACLPWPIGSRTARRNVSEKASPSADVAASAGTRSASKQRKSLDSLKPTSLYPASLLGTAMVARGEIGFLISSVAESDGVFASGNTARNSELFLVVTWAILLCTLIGPIGVGLMVKRVKRLQAAERSQASGKRDPLGIWGVGGGS